MTITPLLNANFVLGYLSLVKTPLK